MGESCGKLSQLPAMLVSVSRAKRILLVLGICVALIGGMLLPFPTTSPEALTQSLFVWIAMTGAFTRPGIILLLVGLACVGLGLLLPSDRE